MCADGRHHRTLRLPYSARSESKIIVAGCREFKRKENVYENAKSGVDCSITAWRQKMTNSKEVKTAHLETCAVLVAHPKILKEPRAIHAEGEEQHIFRHQQKLHDLSQKLAPAVKSSVAHSALARCRRVALVRPDCASSVAAD